MAVERDFNDVLDDIVMSEDAQERESYQEGFQAGLESGNPEGFHLGYHRGVQLGRELGYYLGTVSHHIKLSEAGTEYPEKTIKQLNRVKDLINEFPRTNSEDHDIVKMAETIKAQYKKACALLKISSNYPYEAGISF